MLRSVSLTVEPGEVRALVGESGAGKTMIGKAMFGVLPPRVRIAEGRIRLEGIDLGTLSPKERRRLIGAQTALIPQDPLTALNPSRRVGPQMTDRLIENPRLGRREGDKRIRQLLDEVHIREPDRVMRAYPHELSGGMRQRVLIAAAFAAEPRLIVADEPTTALDVTVQKQILRLIARDAARARHGDPVRHARSRRCRQDQPEGDRALRWQVVEEADSAALFAAPQHPYTRALMAATPRTPTAGLAEAGRRGRARRARREIAAADRGWRARAWLSRSSASAV